MTVGVFCVGISAIYGFSPGDFYVFFHGDAIWENHLPLGLYEVLR